MYAYVCVCKNVCTLFCRLLYDWDPSNIINFIESVAVIGQIKLTLFLALYLDPVNITLLDC